MDEMTETVACPWSPLTLMFRDSNQEVGFWDTRVKSFLMNMDSLCWAIRSFFLYLMYWLLTRANKMQPVFQLGVALNGIAYALMAVGSHKKTAWYSKRRTLFICFCRLTGMVFFAMMMAAWNPPQETMTFFILRIVVSTMVGGVVCFPLFAQCQFFPSFVTNCIAAAISVSWTSDTYCNAWFHSDGFRPVIHNFASALDSWISWFTMLYLKPSSAVVPMTDDPDAERSSCWLVVAFLNVSFLGILPSTAIYIMESRARVSFILSSTQDRASRLEYSSMWRGIVCVVLWGTTVLLMMVWWSLRGMADYNQVFQDRVMSDACIAN